MLQVMGRFAIRDAPKVSRGSVVLTSPSVSPMARSSNGNASIKSQLLQHRAISQRKRV
jgi:hypothetical protein